MTKRTTLHTILLPVLGLGIGGILVGCDPGDRPLNYEKGVYQGKPPQPIDEATLERLRDRAAYQSGPKVSTSPGFGGRSGGIVGGPMRPVSAPLQQRPQGDQPQPQQGTAQEQPQAAVPQTPEQDEQAQQPAPAEQLQPGTPQEPQAQPAEPPQPPAPQDQPQETPPQQPAQGEQPQAQQPTQNSEPQEQPAEPARSQGDAGARPADQ